MTSTVTIDLDLKIVQQAIDAKVAPAVERILSKIDLEKKIADALTKLPRPERDYFLQASMLGYSRHELPIIDALLAKAIKDAALEFINKAVAKERPKIEAAFKRMMADSSDKLARTMFSALQGGLKSEWTFDIRTEMTPTQTRND